MKETLTAKQKIANMKTACRLKALLVSKGLKASWVADQMGATQTMLSYLLAGYRTWTPETERKFLAAIGEK